jgi:hypothetical protein
MQRAQLASPEMSLSTIVQAVKSALKTKVLKLQEELLVIIDVSLESCLIVSRQRYHSARCKQVYMF